MSFDKHITLKKMLEYLARKQVCLKGVVYLAKPKKCPFDKKYHLRQTFRVPCKKYFCFWWTICSSQNQKVSFRQKYQFRKTFRVPFKKTFVFKTLYSSQKQKSILSKKTNHQFPQQTQGILQENGFFFERLSISRKTKKSILSTKKVRLLCKKTFF